MMQPSVAVMTASRCAVELYDAVRSVAKQTYPNIKHYIMVDAAASQAQYIDTMNRLLLPNQYWVYWPTSIKRPLMNASRIYAAMPSLINEDITIMLNEDDWFEKDHVESLVTAIVQNDYDWAFSHRKIYDKSGDFLCEDKCESLGEDHDVWNLAGHRFVETCSLAMKTEAYKVCAQVFNWPSAVNDRVFYAHAKELFPKFGSTRKATMCFRLGGNENSVTKEFFDQGNAFMEAKYKGVMPWESASTKSSSQRRVRSTSRRKSS